MPRQKYHDWIAAHVESDGYAQCAEMTLAMAAAFPELTRVRGYYHCPWWNRRAHWWLTTPSGQIVDPTVAQFPSRGTGDYVTLDESAAPPTGQCLNCGEDAYQGDTFCSRECEDVTAAEFNREIRGRR